MILKALVELAEREGLMADLDYQPVAVRWIVTIDSEGRMLGEIADTQRPAADKKGRPQPAIYAIPSRSKRTAQKAACEFVVEKPEYVFGCLDETGIKATDPNRLKKLEGRRQRAILRRDLYRTVIQRAAERSGDEGLAALARFLNGPLPALPETLESSDLVGFMYYGDETVRLITDRPKVRWYWSLQRRENERATGRRPSGPKTHEEMKVEPGTMFCLITGDRCEPIRLHPNIKGLPPKDASGGVPLTSVDKPAFKSYGQDDFSCAPVSRRAADAYQAALNRLLGNKQRHSRLSFNSVVVFWSEGDGGLVDLFSDAVASGNPDSIRALYGSAWKGSPIRLDDLSPFYCLTLSGAKGRGTVRGWNETTLGAVMNNLRQYFKDIDITRKEDEPRPLRGNQRFPGLLNLLALQNKEENIPPGLAADIFAAILTGTVFPRSVLSSAVQRVRCEHNEDNIRFHEHKRFALLKAYLCRARRAGDLSIPEVKSMLDEECKAPAYRLGRLFAVLEKIQDEAINANASIRDRYFGAASATPVLVFPQLVRKVNHHYAKSKRPKYYARLVGDIICGLPAESFPPVLKLEEQGLFAVGYYHQRQALFTKREEPPAGSTETQPK